MPDFHLPDADGYLVALSGGADSRLLLELTVRAALLRHPDRPVGDRVTAVHLHHGIRGAEADRDEAFCHRICDGCGVPLIVEHADIPARAAASGRSVETEAREARYALFRRVMAERRIPVLLTAHHADDQLETVLHHLLRGTGTRGMGGIPPMRALHDGAEASNLPTADSADGTPHESAVDLTQNPYVPMLFRPLLTWTRRDILAACDELALTYVNDSTNLVGDCTRNRLRLEVIPALEAIAGVGVPQRTVGRLAAAAREDDEALTAMARARYETAINATDALVESAEQAELTVSAALPVDAVRGESVAIAKRMIGLAYAAFYRQMGDFHRNGDHGKTVENRDSTVGQFSQKFENSADLSAVAPERTLSAHHLESLLALCREGGEGAVSDCLPGDVRAAIQGGRLVFRPPTGKVVGTPSNDVSSAEDGSAEERSVRIMPCTLSEGVTIWSTAADGCAGIIVEVTCASSPLAPDVGADVWSSAVFPREALPWPLWLRCREAGDVIFSHGMNKKIKKLLCDKHIPSGLRACLPLVCLPDSTPLWVPGVAFRDGFPAPDTGACVRITVRVME